MDDGGMTERNTVKERYEEEAEYHDILYEEADDRYPANIVRADLTRNALAAADDVKSVIDIGCGTGQVMIELLEAGYDVQGFDFAENMVEQARENLRAAGFQPELVRHGDLMSDIPFDRNYDAAVALGVLPHFSDITDPLLRSKRLLGDQGLLLAQLRNDLFDMFTFNEYTYRFYRDELLADVTLPPDAESALDERLRSALNLDDGVGKSSGDAAFESGEHQHYHNPLTVEELFAEPGFSVEDILFYHYHAMLPEFETEFTEVFYEESLALEDPTDWRGYLLASAYLVGARVE